MVSRSNKPTVRIELTAEQQEQIRRLTGKDVTVVKLRLQELEARLAPGFGPN